MGTFSFIVQVADSASATTSEIFTVAIDNNHPYISLDASFSGSIQLLIDGGAGPNYTLQSTTNLVNWRDVFTTNLPVLPFSWSDSTSTGSVRQFYRVKSGH